MPTEAWSNSDASAAITPPVRASAGLKFPFARMSSDFARTTTVGEAVKDSITQILGVRADDGRSYGELPWRPEFGSLLHRLQYMNLDETFAAIARSRVIGAISRWEPRCQVRDVEIFRDDAAGGTSVRIRVLYDLVQPGTGALVAANEHVEVPVSG